MLLLGFESAVDKCSVGTIARLHFPALSLLTRIARIDSSAERQNRVLLSTRRPVRAHHPDGVMMLRSVRVLCVAGRQIRNVIGKREYESEEKSWKSFNVVARPCVAVWFRWRATARCGKSLKAPRSAADIFLECRAINLGKHGVVRIQ